MPLEDLWGIEVECTYRLAQFYADELGQVQKRLLPLGMNVSLPPPALQVSEPSHCGHTIRLVLRISASLGYLGND